MGWGGGSILHLRYVRIRDLERTVRGSGSRRSPVEWPARSAPPDLQRPQDVVVDAISLTPPCGVQLGLVLQSEDCDTDRVELLRRLRAHRRRLHHGVQFVTSFAQHLVRFPADLGTGPRLYHLVFDGPGFGLGVADGNQRLG